MFTFSHNLNYALGWTVMHSLWQIMLISLVTGLVLIALRKSSARLRYFVAMSSLFLVFLAAIATFFIYYDFSKEPGEVVFAPDAASATATVSIDNQADRSITETFATERDAATSGLSWDGLKTYVNRNIYLIVMFWLMGVTLFLLRLLGSVSYISFLRAKHNFPVEEYWQDMLDKLCHKVEWNSRIELVESALVRSPLVVGFLKPMILFPIGAINRLNPEEVEAILAHEMAHVLRHDYALNILQSVVEALFFFHPGIWWLSAQARNERENACDDMAIALCGSSITYAKSLVSVQEMAYYTPQMAMGFAGQRSAGNQLLLRVQRALQHNSSAQSTMEKIVSTAILAVVVVGLAFGSKLGNHNVTAVSDVSQGQPKTQEETDSNAFGKPSFIKYTINGCMDSLPVDSHVKDGTYYFSDNTQEVALTVKDRSVIRFNINGLEIDSEDIPKFSKLINKIVQAEKEAKTDYSSRTESFTESHADSAPEDPNAELQSPPTPSVSQSELHAIKGNMLNNISDKPLTIIEKTGKRYVLIGKGDQVKLVTITAPGEKPMVLALDEKGQVQHNSNAIDANTLKNLGWKQANGSLVKIDGFKDIRSIQEGFGGQPDSFQEVGSALGWVADLIASQSDEEKKQAKAQSSHAESMAKHDADMARHNAAMQTHNAAMQHKWIYTICEALRNEGLVEEGEPAHFTIDYHSAMVNDKKLTANQLKKYQKLYEKTTGVVFTKDVTAYFSTDDGCEPYESDEQSAIPPPTPATPQPKVNFNYSLSSNDDEDGGKDMVALGKKFDNWLLQELSKDGYITDKKHYRWRWTNDSMQVNGKKVKQNHFQKYTEKWAEYFGSDPDDDFSRTKTVSEN